MLITYSLLFVNHLPFCVFSFIVCLLGSWLVLETVGGLVTWLVWSSFLLSFVPTDRHQDSGTSSITCESTSTSRSPPRSLRTSDFLYLRWPPRVLSACSFPSISQRHTVFGLTWNMSATCFVISHSSSLLTK